MQSVYVYLRTSVSTRAVHLEIIQDLTVESFLQSLPAETLKEKLHVLHQYSQRTCKGPFNALLQYHPYNELPYSLTCK